MRFKKNYTLKVKKKTKMPIYIKEGTTLDENRYYASKIKLKNYQLDDNNKLIGLITIKDINKKRISKCL